ncbi:MAG: hypothetical protein QMD00_00515 [Hadesarchaea archaeon]|nr:hypothetical protein [Hadesarchaea archaeon]
MYSINDPADGMFVFIQAITPGKAATFNWGPLNLGPPAGTAGSILEKSGTLTGTNATYELKVPSDSAYGFPRGSIGSLTLYPNAGAPNTWDENTEFVIRVTCGGRRIETTYATMEPFESSLP